jgi:nitrogen fixation protein FixH
MKIRPDIAWPVFIIALILLGMSAGFGVVIASRWDGGPEIIKNYYAESLAWNETMETRAESARLGWKITTRVEGRARSEEPVPVVLSVVDADGAPLDGLTGQVKLSRPHRAEEVGFMDLAPAGEPGAYRLLIPQGFPGLWDLGLNVRRDEANLIQTLRVEILP